MKRICALTLLAGMLAVPAVFAAGVVSVQLPPGGYGPYQTGVGGEFTFSISPSLVANGYVNGATKNVPSSFPSTTTTFQTFCVEGAETISGGSSYTANYNNQSVFTNFRLSYGAAWLYAQFVTQGTFGGYLGAVYNYGVGRGTTAALVQNAIWALMGGQEGKTPTTEASNPFFNAALAAFGGTFASADAPAPTGYDNVYVLNLWDSSGRAAQDQLIYTEGPIPNVIPDGGITVMLLGMGLTGLGIVSRRFRR